LRPFAVLLALLLVVLSAGTALAVFIQSEQVPGNTFSTKTDWAAPTVSTSVIAKTVGYAAGQIKQGATYYVFANITDSGNPASGVSGATANVSSIDSGVTAAALTAGSFSIEGVSYNYRSASLTANGTITAGSYGYTITATDAAGNGATKTGLSVTVDNTAPSATDVQTTNAGINGRAESGDTIVVTFSEAPDPNSILSGWTGASTNVVVRLNTALSADNVTIYNAANSAQLPLGTIQMGRTDYTSSNRTFGASGTASTMVLSGSAITITLGTQSGAATTAAGTGTMAWTPSSTAQDRAGNACTTTARNETGTADKDF
jgi:hypothetical protein